VAARPALVRDPQAFDLPNSPRIGYNAAREPDVVRHGVVRPVPVRWRGPGDADASPGRDRVESRAECLTLRALLERCATF
jgi:hypothetical protein